MLKFVEGNLIIIIASIVFIGVAVFLSYPEKEVEPQNQTIESVLDKVESVIDKIKE